MADAVNLRRLSRACSRLFHRDKRSVQRLRAYCADLRVLLARASESGAMDHDESLAHAKKIAVFEAFVRENEDVLEQQGEEKKQELEQREERFAIERQLSEKMEIFEHELEQKEREIALVDDGPAAMKKELIGEREETSRMEKLIGSQNFGAKAMAKQLESLRMEKENLEADVVDLVDQLRRRVVNTNEAVKSDTARIDKVNKKLDDNLNYVEKMSAQLNISLNSSTYGCRACTMGVGLVLALWVLAYLVMRIFPKVKH